MAWQHQSLPDHTPLPFASQASPQGSTLGPSGTQPGRWALARRLWRWRGDQGPQRAGGRDESPSVMRSLGPACQQMDPFLPAGPGPTPPSGPTPLAPPGTCVQLGPGQRPLLLEPQAPLPAGGDSGLQAPSRGCEPGWQVTCALCPQSTHPSAGHVVAALASQGREEVRIKDAVCESALGELTGGILEQRAHYETLSVTRRVRGAGRLPTGSSWSTGPRRGPTAWSAPLLPAPPEQALVPPLLRVVGPGPFSALTWAFGTERLELLSARSGLSPSGDEVTCTAPNLGPVLLVGGAGMNPPVAPPQLGSTQAASSEDEGGGHRWKPRGRAAGSGARL